MSRRCDLTRSVTRLPVYQLSSVTLHHHQQRQAVLSWAAFPALPETDGSLCKLQSKLRKDAAAAQVEQQKKEKEAVQAANEATLAQLNEQHNLVRCL